MNSMKPEDHRYRLGCLNQICSHPLPSIVAAAYCLLCSNKGIQVYTNTVILGGYLAQAGSDDLELGPRDYILILGSKRNKSEKGAAVLCLHGLIGKESCYAVKKKRWQPGKGGKMRNTEAPVELEPMILVYSCNLTTSLL